MHLNLNLDCILAVGLMALRLKDLKVAINLAKTCRFLRNGMMRRIRESCRPSKLLRHLQRLNHVSDQTYPWRVINHFDGRSCIDWAMNARMRTDIVTEVQGFLRKVYGINRKITLHLDNHSGWVTLRNWLPAIAGRAATIAKMRAFANDMSLRTEGFCLHVKLTERERLLALFLNSGCLSTTGLKDWKVVAYKWNRVDVALCFNPPGQERIFYCINTYLSKTDAA